MKVFYTFESNRHTTREGDPDDQWDRDSTSTSWYAPDTVYLESLGYRDEDDIPDDNLKPGDVVFLVWVQYSTGDSFGHDAGAGMEIIGWYRDHHDAYRARDAIEERSQGKYSFEEGGNTAQVPTYDGTGQRPHYCGSWLGYFENVDSVSVSTVRIAA